MVHEEEIEFYKTLLPNLKIVFDVGCQNDNIFFELNPSLEVHLFDPQINETLSTNGNVHYNNYALGNTIGWVDFHYNYGSMLLRDDEPKFTGSHQTKKVRVNTLFNYCKKNKISEIDLLKIDTEGWDFEVIKGCGEMIKHIKYIQFEVWDTTIDDIIEFLSEYNIYEIGGKPMNLLATKETMNLKKYRERHK